MIYYTVITIVVFMVMLTWFYNLRDNIIKNHEHLHKIEELLKSDPNILPKNNPKYKTQNQGEE